MPRQRLLGGQMALRGWSGRKLPRHKDKGVSCDAQAQSKVVVDRRGSCWPRAECWRPVSLCAPPTRDRPGHGPGRTVKRPWPSEPGRAGHADSSDGHSRSSSTSDASTSAFRRTYNKEPWTLSMSAVLSENGNSIWVMAWLDQCPKTAAEVPRTALLRLLGEERHAGQWQVLRLHPGQHAICARARLARTKT